MPLPPAPSKKATILPTSAYASTGEGNSRKAGSRSRTADSAHPEAKREAPEALLAIPAAPAAPAPAKAPSRRKTASTQVSALLSPPATAPAVAKSTAASPAAAPLAAPTPAAEAPAAPARSRKARHAGPTKLFVLDTNVLMHDPMCLFRFEEHDIFLPMIVLEELDSHKKGMTEVARNARQTSRSLDALAAAQGADITAGLKLDTTGHREAGGKLFFQTRPLNYTLPTSLPQGKADNQILGVVEALRHLHSPQGQEGQPTREVVLVSKDINMRVKARALGLTAEDYQNDRHWKTSTCCTPAPWRCLPTSGPRTASRSRAGKAARTPITAFRAPSCPICLSTSSCSSKTRA